MVGRELVRLLGADQRYGVVHVLLRRPAPELEQDAKLRTVRVDFAALPALPRVDDVYVALGTTIKAAGSPEAFRRVDHDHVLAVARAARAAGATRLGVVSAHGADAASRVFYSRVKGEVERAVSVLGYERVVLARPSLLLGDRAALGQATRRGEAWAQKLLSPVLGLVPLQVRPVESSDVARSLIDAVLQQTSGVTVIASRDMHRR